MSDLAPSTPRLNPLHRLRGLFMRAVYPNDDISRNDVAPALVDPVPLAKISGFDHLVVLIKKFVDFDNGYYQGASRCGTCGKVALDFGRAKRSRASRIHRILIINDPEIHSWQDLSGRDLTDYLLCTMFILNGVVQKNRNGYVGFSVRQEDAQ